MKRISFKELLNRVSYTKAWRENDSTLCIECKTDWYNLLHSYVDDHSKAYWGHDFKTAYIPVPARHLTKFNALCYTAWNIDENGLNLKYIAARL